MAHPPSLLTMRNMVGDFGGLDKWESEWMKK